MEVKEGPNVLIGLTGSVASIKAPVLVNELLQLPEIKSVWVRLCRVPPGCVWVQAMW